MFWLGSLPVLPADKAGDNQKKGTRTEKGDVTTKTNKLLAGCSVSLADKGRGVRGDRQKGVATKLNNFLAKA